ncbi:unnamed protein product, partial [Mesorhabditis belari]|uniref:Uncharacterized protein n=1 Tax=Mesorhabditis belari TaxID=2138241 RepID=A0AAF3EEK5_9BILA
MSRQASPPNSPSALSALNVKLGVSDDESSAKRKISPRSRVPSSMPTSPASGQRLDPFEDIQSSHSLLTGSQKRKKRSMLHSKSASPPPTPTRLGVESGEKGAEVQKRSLFRQSSQEKKRSAISNVSAVSATSIEDEGWMSSLRAARRPFQSAHQSFRLRMLQEQHGGFEPVFVTKKRTREGKSMMSEFKGGDLNKYTARSYAIQNGNEVFGGELIE